MNRSPEGHRYGNVSRRWVLGTTTAAAMGLTIDHVTDGPLSNIFRRKPDAEPYMSVKGSELAKRFHSLLYDNTLALKQIEPAVDAMTDKEFAERFRVTTFDRDYGTETTFSLTIPEKGQESIPLARLQPTIQIIEDVRPTNGVTYKKLSFVGSFKKDGKLATLPIGGQDMGHALDQTIILERTKMSLQQFSPGLYADEPWLPAGTHSDIADSRYTTVIKDAVVDAEQVRGHAASNGKFKLEIFSTKIN